MCQHWEEVVFGMEVKGDLMGAAALAETLQSHILWRGKTNCRAADVGLLSVQF
jgi:hypothetical protein